MSGLGKGGGLTKATAGARRAIRAALGRPCVLHHDRPAAAVILTLGAPRPACMECADYARGQGYNVVTAAELGLDAPQVGYENVPSSNV